ncbi:chromatin remodelling complex subunit [Reticulomyxa filosa]|uniref:Chromatin remodelling complex subunit n=1 Tax=Reticulomyxa filosa TaxID=46433 RepID=X6LT84_RETFI|nr:chromatin remodelling complex subunit [Reticulomyxa filosa]|eukprot:ETO04317.1 chromatin remodelling complex subunit [Reticulomyxa filosa]
MGGSLGFSDTPEMLQTFFWTNSKNDTNFRFYQNTLSRSCCPNAIARRQILVKDVAKQLAVRDLENDDFDLSVYLIGEDGDEDESTVDEDAKSKDKENNSKSQQQQQQQQQKKKQVTSETPEFHPKRYRNVGNQLFICTASRD